MGRFSAFELLCRILSYKGKPFMKCPRCNMPLYKGKDCDNCGQPIKWKTSKN